MTKTQLLADRLREVFLNGKWIANTNYREQLLNVNLKHALHQIDNLNTIAALTFHVNYYLSGLLDVLNGGNLEIRDKYSFDLPEIKTETDWNNLVSGLISNAEKFADKVAEMDDVMLEQPFTDEKYGTYMRNIEGVLEHSYYHLGQISLIRKLLINKL